MKKQLILSVVFGLAVVCAQASTTTPAAAGSAAAEIIAPATLAHAEGATLNFGRFIPTVAGTVVVPAQSGSNIATYTGVTEASGGAPSTADHFTVSNLSLGTTYNVNLPATITLQHNSDSLTVSSLTHNAGTDSTATDFYVGGTLTVPQNAPAGNYSASYDVTITY